MESQLSVGTRVVVKENLWNDSLPWVPIKVLEKGDGGTIESIYDSPSDENVGTVEVCRLKLHTGKTVADVPTSSLRREWSIAKFLRRLLSRR